MLKDLLLLKITSDTHIHKQYTITNPIGTKLHLESKIIINQFNNNTVSIYNMINKNQINFLRLIIVAIYFTWSIIAPINPSNQYN